MWPFAHLAVGYLLYSAYSHARFRRPPDQTAAVLVVFGTQLADFIDKPLALLGVLESGRSLGHSYLVVLPVILLVGGAVYRMRGEFGPTVAFGMGYASAPLGDGAPQFLQGTFETDLREVSFWVWPFEFPAERIADALAQAPGIGHTITHKAAWTAANIPSYPELGLWVRSFEVGVTLLAAGVWVYDGRPGWALARDVVRSVREKR
ncbi:hypothetical protein NDI76_16230 [Halogeometricum sp. S1BR25-6]|uniref:Membrane-bound metal-dependent hydrolase n=1 Tax=Halogeometricum salsisoli TaxID=2950536 RepID=A0ABU2GHK5_9EURY|nr:metal-dependent hydrolase [Halogeometricum sp. S1BR25-6]MDS0300295.1 hypothetical protein [Halogeometricum sp. S1BR25-6]